MIETFFKTNLIKILAGIIAALALALVVMILVNAHHVNQRDAARTAKKEQVAEYRRVYNETFKRHFDAANAENSRLASIKEEADNVTEPRRRAALASAAGYAARHRCSLQGTPNPGPASGSNLPGAAAATGSVEEPAPGTALVGITEDGFNACTLNTADLWTAYEWGQKLPKPAP